MPVVGAEHRPEVALLLAIARVELTEGEKAQLKNLLAGAIDWPYLLDLAGMHGLEPLLLLHLEQNAAAMVPPDEMQSLRESCRRIAMRNLILATRLGAISAHFRRRGIEHISFKGPLLAEVYYGNGALRSSSDLDILVPEAKVAAARDALDEIGFSDQFGLNKAQQALVFRFNHEHGFTSADGVVVDLQWGLAPKLIAGRVDMAGIWRRVRMARLVDCEVPTFGPEDLLFGLLLHAGNDNHAWAQFSQFCDMVQVLKAHPQMDWDIVESHLGDAYTRRSVYVSLYILQKYWQARIPAELLTRIASDPWVARLADCSEREWWPMPALVETKSALRWLLNRSRGEAAGDRARLLFGNIFTPTRNDFKAFNLPGILKPLYPALRVLRFVGECAGRHLRDRRNGQAGGASEGLL